MNSSPDQGPTSRFAVPLSELDAIKVTEAQLVESASDSHQLPAPAALPAGDAGGDDGD